MLARVAFAALLLGCAAPPARPAVVPVSNPPIVAAPRAPAKAPQTGIVDFVKWVAPRAKDAVVSGVDAGPMAEDLRAAGIDTYIAAPNARRCLEDLPFAVVIVGTDGPPRIEHCVWAVDGLPPVVIMRGRRENVASDERHVFQDVNGLKDGEVFAVAAFDPRSSERYVPVDRRLVPNGDGTWTAFGDLVRTPEMGIAIRGESEMLRVALDGAAPKGGVVRVTGHITFTFDDWDGTDVGMRVTHVDGALDRRAADVLADQASEASDAAARLLDADERLDALVAACAVLRPVRDAFVHAFGADAGRAELFSAVIAATGTITAQARAYALARAATAGPLASDATLRRALFRRAAIGLRAIDDDSAEARRAADALSAAASELHIAPPDL